MESNIILMDWLNIIKIPSPTPNWCIDSLQSQLKYQQADSKIYIEMKKDQQ